MSGATDRGCLIELGGPQDGRAIGAEELQTIGIPERSLSPNQDTVDRQRDSRFTKTKAVSADSVHNRPSVIVVDGSLNPGLAFLIRARPCLHNAHLNLLRSLVL